MMRQVPTLDELAAHPEQIANIPSTVAAALLAKLASLQPVLLVRALAPAGNGIGDTTPTADRLLTVAEAAELLGHSKDWLYRRADRLPFTVRTGRDLRFSAAGLARWIRNRQGAH